MPSRFEYERAVRESDLAPLSRLLALTIATWANARTGVIPDQLMPSLTALEDATGMARASVRTHLDKLEEAGWLIRNRPSKAAARAEKARTKYKIRIPKGAAVPDTSGIELGQDAIDARAGDALDGGDLGQEPPQARAGAALELGQEMSTARAGAALSSSASSESSAECKPAGSAVNDYGIPEQARPLVDSMTASGVVVRWPFQGNAWFPLLALIAKCGVPAMVGHAIKAASRSQVESANYFMSGWRELPPLPPVNAARPPLKAVSGGWQPFQATATDADYENGF